MFSCCWPWIMCLGVFFIYTSLRHDVFLLRAIRKKRSLNLLTFTLTELLCASLKKRHRNHIPSYQVYTSTSNNWFVFSFWPGGGNFGACRCLVLSSTSLCRVFGWWDVCVWGHSNRNVTITTTYCCRAAPTIYIYMPCCSPVYSASLEGWTITERGPPPVEECEERCYFAYQYIHTNTCRKRFVVLIFPILQRFDQTVFDPTGNTDAFGA